MLNKSIILPIITILFISPAYADGFQQANLSYEVCFTPGGQCTQEIVDTLNSAKKQVLVQAYQLTSAPIT